MIEKTKCFPGDRSEMDFGTFTMQPNFYYNLMGKMKDSEWKTLSFLFRVTFGFGTQEVRITQRQICEGVKMGIDIEGTNQNIKTVQKCISALVSYGILEITDTNNRLTNSGNLYRIEIDPGKIHIENPTPIKSIPDSMEVEQFKALINIQTRGELTVNEYPYPPSEMGEPLIKIKENKENIYASQFDFSSAIKKESVINRVNINTVVKAKEEFKELEYVPAEGTREYDILERKNKRQEKYRAKKDKKHVSAVVCGVPYEIDWFPDDIIMVVKKFCQIWRIVPPTTRSQMAYWITGARELKDACAEYQDAIILELKKEQDKEIEEGKSPLNVSSPRSLVQRAMNKARIWREEDYKKKLAGQ